MPSNLDSMDIDTPSRTRIDFLEKESQSRLYELNLLASFGNLCHEINLSKGSAEDILAYSTEHIERLMDFQWTAFYMVDEETRGFGVTQANPVTESQKIQQEMDRLIEQGDFSWALNQNRAVVTSSRANQRLILHSLITPSGAQGMFAGVLKNKQKALLEADLYPLSILIQATSNAVENLLLTNKITKQNENLEKLVRKRTLSLENQSRELMEEITQRSMAEESLLVAKEEAEASARVKTQFIANISHEFRTPLNAIMGYGEILKYEAEKLNRADILKDIASIDKAGKHLLKLINDTLDLSKIQAGKMNFNLEWFKVVELVDDVITTIRPLAKKNGNRFSVTYQGPVQSMNADVFRIRQVLLNILGNACKFTQEGLITLKISAKPLHGEEWIYFVISDNGIGIESDKLEEIFSEYGQASPRHSGKFEGSGLGLSISKRLCELMAGTIAVSSKPDEGSEFTLAFPIDITTVDASDITNLTDLPQNPVHPSTQANDPSNTSEEVSPTLQQTSMKSESENPSDLILVIDDDAIARDLIQRFLERHGYQVETAAGGEEGFKKAKELQPKVITLDLIMPEMDGWEVLAKLKEEVNETPVIIISIMDQREKALKEGAAEFLTKPVDWSRFLDSLKKYCRFMPPAPILVVDDDSPNRGALCRVLVRDGWRTQEAVDGADAILAVQKEIPSLILLDLVMPTMDGFDFILRLRENQKWQSVPILVLTAKELTQSEKNRLSGQVEKVFQKGNYTRNELLNEIRSLTIVS